MTALRVAVGFAIVGLALSVGGIDSYYAARNWHRMGPLPKGAQVEQFRVAVVGGEGGVFSSQDLGGKVSVVTFWATWCPACIGELGDLDKLAPSYADKDVQFLAVNNEGASYSVKQRRAKVAGFRQQTGLSIPTAVDDGSTAKYFRVGPIPHTVIVDRTGKVRHLHQGRVSADTIAAEVDALLAEG